MEGIASLMNNRDQDQKYCVAIHFENAIYLLHSVYMVEGELFGCSARSDILPSFIRFHVTELTLATKGLVEFCHEGDNTDFRIPTVTELLRHEDVESFAEYPPLLQVPLVTSTATFLTRLMP